MFKLFVLAAMLGLAYSAALDTDVHAETKSLENDISPEGVFKYAFQTSNGIDVDSAGDLHAIAGSYKYVSPEGETVHLVYTADENGFHPEGDHLPTPPPIPEAIARAIQWIEAHPPAPEPLGHGKL